MADESARIYRCLTGDKGECSLKPIYLIPECTQQKSPQFVLELLQIRKILQFTVIQYLKLTILLKKLQRVFKLIYLATEYMQQNPPQIGIEL